MASVSVIQVGRVKNVPLGMTSARYQIATVTGIAPTENAIAFAVTKGSSVRRWIVHIRRARVTVSAQRERVFVRRDGRAQIVARWIKKRCSVYQIAAAMETLISKLKLVYASLCGPVTIARKVNFHVNHYIP